MDNTNYWETVISRETAMYKNKLILVIAIFLIFSQLLICQNKKLSQKQTEKQQLKEYFEDAEYFFDREDYREALFNFQKVNASDTANANICYRIGMCYINIPGEENKAIPYFERALPKISVKYNKSTFEERKAPLYLLFYLGNAYRVDNQISKALEVYNKFRNHPYFEGNYNAGMVDTEIAACQRAKVIQDNPINVRFTNLGKGINTPQSNRCAVVNRDETLLVYLSEQKLYDAIMACHKVNGVWSEPENISPQVGSDGDCEPTCLSADGNDLYFVKKTKGNYDIYVSHYKDGLWTSMVALNKNINSSKMETFASVSADGKTLYFSSDRRGGFGKLDIYKSEKLANGDWGSAINLGENINTESNETNPVICEVGKTLYFSSEGLLNMGGYDVFVSQLSANNKWEKSANVGFPINTTGNDVGYYPIKNGEIAYYSLVRKDGYGREDIYRVENLTIQSRNNHITGDKIKQRKIVVRDKVTNEILGILIYDQNSDSLKIQQSSENIDIKIDK